MWDLIKDSRHYMLVVSDMKNQFYVLLSSFLNVK